MRRTHSILLFVIVVIAGAVVGAWIAGLFTAPAPAPEPAPLTLPVPPVTEAPGEPGGPPPEPPSPPAPTPTPTPFQATGPAERIQSTHLEPGPLNYCAQAQLGSRGRCSCVFEAARAAMPGADALLREMALIEALAAQLRDQARLEACGTAEGRRLLGGLCPAPGAPPPQPAADTPAGAVRAALAQCPAGDYPADEVSLLTVELSRQDALARIASSCLASVGGDQALCRCLTEGLDADLADGALRDLGRRAWAIEVLPGCAPQAAVGAAGAAEGGATGAAIVPPWCQPLAVTPGQAMADAATTQTFGRCLVSLGRVATPTPEEIILDLSGQDLGTAAETDAAAPAAAATPAPAVTATPGPDTTPTAAPAAVTPTPSPAASPSPTATATPRPSPSPTATATPGPSPSPTATATPGGVPDASAPSLTLPAEPPPSLAEPPPALTEPPPALAEPAASPVAAPTAQP